MNLDKILKIFVPKDHSFLPLFESSSKNLVKASELLVQILSTADVGEHERINREIKEAEHYGDTITDKTFDQLNKSFITPFDREDIHELTAHIDDVVDSINGVSRRICIYRLTNLQPVCREMAELIHLGAKEIETAVNSLHDAAANKNIINKACENVTTYEHKADELYFVGTTDLFQKEHDTKELLKNNKILEILERCVDEEEDVTDVLKTILIKMA